MSAARYQWLAFCLVGSLLLMASLLKADIDDNDEPQDDEGCRKRDPHSHYEACGTSRDCQSNCKNWQNDVRPCNNKCGNGCHCEPGYVKDKDTDGKCVKTEDCPHE